MKNLIAWFKDEEGQGMVEYGLIIGLISIAVITVLVLIGPKLKELFAKADNGLSTAIAGA